MVVLFGRILYYSTFAAAFNLNGFIWMLAPGSRQSCWLAKNIPGDSVHFDHCPVA